MDDVEPHVGQVVERSLSRAILRVAQAVRARVCEVLPSWQSEGDAVVAIHQPTVIISQVRGPITRSDIPPNKESLIAGHNDSSFKCDISKHFGIRVAVPAGVRAVEEYDHIWWGGGRRTGRLPRRHGGGW